MNNTAYLIHVSGVVQGVGFRHYTRRKAEDLGLHGTVMNLDDGRVEIRVGGDPEALLEFLEWCHSGPASAVVRRMEYEAVPPLEYSGFRIIR